MDEFRCEACARGFGSQESLDQHNRDRHGAGGAQSTHELRQLKKQEGERLQEAEYAKARRSTLAKRAVFIAVPILLVAAAFAFVSSQPSATGNPAGFSSDIPNSPIHWHPTLEIIINGQRQTIPANLGLGGAHQPIHTHDATGVLHYENNNPGFENMRLGYFFEKVWRKRFNSTCILDNCNGDGGTMKMLVNGQENAGFGNFVPKDGDKIVIEYG